MREWLFSYLADEYAVPSESVSIADPLEGWGLDDARRLACLAGAFNRTAKSRGAWRGRSVRPPDLVAAVRGKTLDDLLGFLETRAPRSRSTRPPLAGAQLVELASAERPVADRCAEVRRWLRGLLEDWINHAQDVTETSSFADLHIDANDGNANYVERKFTEAAACHLGWGDATVGDEDVRTAMGKRVSDLSSLLCAQVEAASSRHAGHP